MYFKFVIKYRIFFTLLNRLDRSIHRIEQCFLFQPRFFLGETTSQIDMLKIKKRPLSDADIICMSIEISYLYFLLWHEILSCFIV